MTPAAVELLPAGWTVGRPRQSMEAVQQSRPMGLSDQDLPAGVPFPTAYASAFCWAYTAGLTPSSASSAPVPD